MYIYIDMQSKEREYVFIYIYIHIHVHMHELTKLVVVYVCNILEPPASAHAADTPACTFLYVPRPYTCKMFCLLQCCSNITYIYIYTYIHTYIYIYIYNVC